MKFLVVAAVVVAVVISLAVGALRSQLANVDYDALNPAPEIAPAQETEGGGSPRNPDHRPASAAPASGTTTFRGPSGPPHIVGPSEPPPGQ